MSLAELARAAIQFSVFALVFSLGLRAGFSDVVWTLRHPRRLLMGGAAMFVVMPFVTALLVAGLDLRPAVTVMLIAVALSPVPPFLPDKMLKSGGERSRVVGGFVAAGLLAIALIPMGLELIAGWFDFEADFDRGPLIRVIGLSVLLPIAAGLMVHQFAPEVSRRVAGPIGKASVVILGLGVLPVLAGGLPEMWALIGDGTLLAIAGFVVLGLTVGHLFGSGRGGDAEVLALAAASRHPGVALVIAAQAAPSTTHVPAAVLLYLLVSVGLTGLYLKWSDGRATATRDGTSPP